jgi:hypothetical protein
MILFDLLNALIVFVRVQLNVGAYVFLVDECLVLSESHDALHEFHHSNQGFIFLIEDLEHEL